MHGQKRARSPGPDSTVDPADETDNPVSVSPGFAADQVSTLASVLGMAKRGNACMRDAIHQGITNHQETDLVPTNNDIAGSSQTSAPVLGSGCPAVATGTPAPTLESIVPFVPLTQFNLGHHVVATVRRHDIVVEAAVLAFRN